MDPVEPRTVSILMRGSLSDTNLPSYHAVTNTTCIVVSLSREPIAETHPFRFLLERPPTLSGAGEDCFRGLYLEVSLALVGVASPAYFQ